MAVLRHVAEELHRNFCQDTKCAFAAHHDFIEVRTGRFSRIVGGDDLTARRRILLRHDHVFRAAVIGRVLAGTSGDDPAADGGVLERLWEVAAGVCAFRSEFGNGVVEVGFIVGTGKTGLDGDGLVYFVEVEDLVVFLSHVERNAALCGLDAARNGRTAAVDIERNLVLCTVFDRFDDLLGFARIEDDVRQGVEFLLAQAQKVVAGLPVHDRDALVVALGPVVTVDALEEVHMLLCHFRRILFAKFHFVEAEVHRVVFEVCIGDTKAVADHLIEGLFRKLEEVRVAPAEDGAERICGCGFGDPLGLEARIRFVRHSILSFVIVSEGRKSR